MINSTNISDDNKKKGFCYSELSNEDYSLIFNLIDNHFKKVNKQNRSKN